jgi:hypothetical protein
MLAELAATGDAIFAVSSVGEATRQAPAYWTYMGPSGMDETAYSAEARRRTFRVRIQSILRPSQARRLVVATVWPGYDDSVLLRAVTRVEGRQSGAFFDSRWRAALRGAPDWVMVTSWNEWWEQTHIAPSELFGSTTLEQTAAWAAEFRDG